MQAQEDDIKFDRYGRMTYHPDFHFKHGKTMSEEELEYLCKFWDCDHYRLVAFALGRTEHSLQTIVYKLKKKGLFDYYKNLNKHW